MTYFKDHLGPDDHVSALSSRPLCGFLLPGNQRHVPCRRHRLSFHCTRQTVGNDIYSCIEMGADGLVLAAETAIGKNPIECIRFVKEMINQFN